MLHLFCELELHQPFSILKENSYYLKRLEKYIPRVCKWIYHKFSSQLFNKSYGTEVFQIGYCKRQMDQFYSYSRQKSQRRFQKFIWSGKSVWERLWNVYRSDIDWYRSDYFWWDYKKLCQRYLIWESKILLKFHQSMFWISLTKILNDWQRLTIPYTNNFTHLLWDRL